MDSSFHSIWFEWSHHIPTTIISDSSFFCHQGAHRFRLWSWMDSSSPHNRNCGSQYRVNVWQFLFAYFHCCNEGDVPRQWITAFRSWLDISYLFRQARNDTSHDTVRVKRNTFNSDSLWPSWGRGSREKFELNHWEHSLNIDRQEDCQYVHDEVVAVSCG